MYCLQSPAACHVLPAVSCSVPWTACRAPAGVNTLHRNAPHTVRSQQQCVMYCLQCPACCAHAAVQCAMQHTLQSNNTPCTACSLSWVACSALQRAMDCLQGPCRCEHAASQCASYCPQSAAVCHVLPAVPCSLLWTACSALQRVMDCLQCPLQRVDTLQCTTPRTAQWHNGMYPAGHNTSCNTRSVARHDAVAFSHDSGCNCGSHALLWSSK
jgi:hypothetical protein